MNPHPGTGSRNLFCSNYSRCLDYAAVRYWVSFHCPSGCDFLKNLVWPDVGYSEQDEHVTSSELRVLRRGRRGSE